MIDFTTPIAFEHLIILLFKEWFPIIYICQIFSSCAIKFYKIVTDDLYWPIHFRIDS